MNRWKGSRSWVMVWGFSLLVGCMILYTGYLGTLYFSSHETTPRNTNVPAQAQSVSTDSNKEAGQTAMVMQTQIGKITADDQASVSNPPKKDPMIVVARTLKDFPSPVQGSSLRSVGNYYSQTLDYYLFHAGIDYAEPEGTIIRATHGGNVIFSGADPILGQKVTLDCGEGWLVTYGGLVNRRVEVGKTVEAQDALGQVGLFPATESESDQPQLHYEVWHGDEVQGSLP